MSSLTIEVAAEAAAAAAVAIENLWRRTEDSRVRVATTHGCAERESEFGS